MTYGSTGELTDFSAAVSISAIAPLSETAVRRQATNARTKTMAIAPMFVKYRAASGNYYVYDPGTNEIVHIGESMYLLLEDFHILELPELIAKHHALGAERISKALKQLEQLQAKGILLDHAPMTTSPAQQVVCRGKQYSIKEFLKNHRRLLILELTQRCNLRCEYCCYGQQYPELRSHGEATLSIDVAKNVVRDFLSHQPQKCLIGFYGGEPLLEFELLQQIVWFTEELASRYDVKPAFSLTTNGTLLTDEKIHFLVKHGFNVMVSMDGPKDIHDRYRVFRDERQGQPLGSYDVVRKNMARFAELYPEYLHRGVSVTLTATCDYNAVNDLFVELGESFPVVSPNLIRGPVENLLGVGADRACEIGVWEEICQCDSCVREPSFSPQETNGDDAEPAKRQSVTRAVAKPPNEVPEFLHWTEEKRAAFRAGHAQFVEELCTGRDAISLRKNFPIFCGRFTKRMAKLHMRPVSNRPGECHFPYWCFPGATRTFCSAQGILYPCEKTETGKLFELGDANADVNVERVISLMEQVRLLGDCGNCVARRLCGVCPAMSSEQGDSGDANRLAFRGICQSKIGDLTTKALQEYTTIMERNQEILDDVLPTTESEDWLSDIRFQPTDEQLAPVELGVEELTELV
ncbi:MAG: radical SAM protein [Planctomycetaceae bacterium]|nr:radical SAM protein [Planctomycetaceae bacterium]